MNLRGLEDEPKDSDDEEIRDESPDGEDVDDEEVLDGREEMTQENIKKLDESVKPVRIVLTTASYPNNEQSFFIIIFLSFEKLHMRLKIPPPLFYLNGLRPLSVWLR